MESDHLQQFLAEIEERICTCGAGHGSGEGHTDWCEWVEAASVALTAALVDVPAVEPVGEAGEMPGSNGGFTMAVFKASDVPVGTKLYTYSLSREGEDSVETIAQRVLDALRAADLGDLLRASDEVALPTIARALAATRSGSATSASGACRNALDKEQP